MIKKEKKPNNKPAFNNYWIYGALIVFFIAVNFIGVGSNNPSNNQINPSSNEVLHMGRLQLHLNKE